MAGLQPGSPDPVRAVGGDGPAALYGGAKNGEAEEAVFGFLGARRKICPAKFAIHAPHTMDPINLAKQLAISTFTLAQTIGTGSLGDSYSLNLHSWRSSHAELRGEYYQRSTKRFEAPGYAIFSASRGSFLEEIEYGIRDEDGSIETVHREHGSAPFSITRASRENWNCEVPGVNGPLVRISRTADFTLLLEATIPKPSRMLATLGGWSRIHLRFPDSLPALSPCTSVPDRSGQNIIGGAPGEVPRTEPIFIRPASMKGTKVMPMSSRVILRPQRVNWIYWDAPRGFGPAIVFEGYVSAPKPEDR